MKKPIWISYDVSTFNVVRLCKFYEPGHSFKCKWTAFVNGLERTGSFVKKLMADSPPSWMILEDSDERKIVKYNDRYTSHTIFQLIEVDVVSVEDAAAMLAAANLGESSGEYCTIGECIATGQHLTECDDDGYCNFCGEQDP
jgi:hypothetical protein